MNEGRKRKLLNYLYPREEIAEFMFNDFFVELSLVLERKTCFSPQNNNSVARLKNLQLAKNTVKQFLKANQNYLDKINEYYKNKNEEGMINDILYGYLLKITSTINRGTGADIFLDKRSICYSQVSILDLL